MEISQLGRTRRRGWDANPASLRNFHRGRFRATPEAKDPLTERGPYILGLKRGRPDDWNFERNDGTRQCHSIIEHHLPRDGLDTESMPRLKINQQHRASFWFRKRVGLQPFRLSLEFLTSTERPDRLAIELWARWQSKFLLLYLWTTSFCRVTVEQTALG